MPISTPTPLPGRILIARVDDAQTTASGLVIAAETHISAVPGLSRAHVLATSPEALAQGLAVGDEIVYETFGSHGFKHDEDRWLSLDLKYVCGVLEGETARG